MKLSTSTSTLYPRGELAAYGIMLRSKRSSRNPRQNVRKTGARIVGMVSIDDPSEGVDGRWVLGDWEADLIIGACGQNAVDRKSVV